MSLKIKKSLCLIITLGLVSLLCAMVPPHPLNTHVPSGYQPTLLDMPARGANGELQPPRIIPNDILVLRVQFSDVHFQDTAVYPDSLVHDTAFFNRWMFQLSDFFADASHYHYVLGYTVYPQVITLPHPISYYGGDVADTTDVNLGGFAYDLIQQVDPLINFSNYEGVIIFHAGAGQESDISGIRTDEIWSTFLTRKRLQGFFDPENDNYPGLGTADGVNLTNIVICPEGEYQDYFPGAEEDPYGTYVFSMYGVLAQQFGHVIGLPTLFDNDSSNGTSQGIGNWGLMGTGVWCNGGVNPAQLDPWSRQYLNWEPVITVTESTENLAVDYFLDQEPDRHRLYKIPISATEYFLIENRQQNPDASLDPYFNQPSWTFKLLPEGEQDYYPNYPLVPEFNFMENRYGGCEWDFYLPGLGGPTPSGTEPVDGSGLLIWHIDENVIAENFTTNFDQNSVNANSLHKGVDIEEADGIQNLDTAIPDQYKYGSPNDTFRESNNNYFGYQTHAGGLSLPVAESYYGGVPLEIYDISASVNQMTFSVNFGWKLSTQYLGPNPINASIVDFDGDGETEIFYPMPDGHLYLWKDELLLPGYPLTRVPVTQNYVWDGSNFYLPMQLNEIARLYRLGHINGEYEANFTDFVWAAQPVANADALYLPLNSTTNANNCLYEFDKDTEQLYLLHEFEYPIVTNMVLFRNRLYISTLQEGSLCIWKYNLENGEFSTGTINIPADSLLVGMYKAPVVPGSETGELILQFANSVYVYYENLMLPNIDSAEKSRSSAKTKDRPVDTYSPVPGFPYIHDMHSTSPLTIADWDTNGSLDLILTSDQGAAVVDYSGSRMSLAALNLAAASDSSFTSGALVTDLDGDGSNELLGNFGYNRLNCWEQDFRPKGSFPVSFGNRSRGMPFLGKASDDLIYAWVATDNGSIYRKALPNAVLADLDSGWNCEYGNLLRQASRDHTSLPNQYASSKLFVQGEVYIYPNPLKSIYENKLTLSVMTNRDTPIELKIFDINGTLIYKQKSEARAYLRNRDLINIPEGKLHSGVYIAVISADTDSYRLKFAVEK